MTAVMVYMMSLFVILIEVNCKQKQQSKKLQTNRGDPGRSKIMTTNIIKSVFKRMLLVLGLMTFISSFAVGQYWTQQKPIVKENLNAVSFPTIYIGVIVGDNGTVLYTSDAGTTWSRLKGLPSVTLTDVKFENEKLGFITGTNGTLYRSTNGGTMWEYINSGTDMDLKTITIGTNGMVYAAGNFGVILRSIDYGTSWKTVATGKSMFRSSSSPKNIDNKLWLAGEGGVIYSSIDGGATFLTQETQTINDLKSIYMFDDMIGYAAGENNTLFFTNSGGKGWDIMNTGITQGLNGVYFVTPKIGWTIGEKGGIFNTINSGILWEPQKTGIQTELKGLCFSNLQRGWAVGINGVIMRWIDKSAPLEITKSETAVLDQNYPNPFNPSTKISFNIPVNGFVSLKIFDISGKQVAELVNSTLVAGNYIIDWNANRISSGIYFYRLETGTFNQTRRMLLIK